MALQSECIGLALALCTFRSKKFAIYDGKVTKKFLVFIYIIIILLSSLKPAEPAWRGNIDMTIRGRSNQLVPHAWASVAHGPWYTSRIWSFNRGCWRIVTLSLQRQFSFLRRFAFSSSHPPMACLKCRCSGALRHGRMTLSSSHEPPMSLRHPPVCMPFCQLSEWLQDTSHYSDKKFRSLYFLPLWHLFKTVSLND